MDWDAIRDNLGLVIFAAVWLLSFLVRAARGRGAPGPVGPIARRRRARRRAVLLGFALMAVAIALWEFSRRLGGEEEALLRLAAGALAVVAVLAILFAGISRPGGAQAAIEMPPPERRAEEISAGEPLEPT